MKRTIRVFSLLLAAVMLLSLLAACSKTEAPAEEPAQEEQTGTGVYRRIETGLFL